jgi:hypothetical protein
MLLILRSFSRREVEQDPPFSTHRSLCPTLRVTSDECPVTSRTDPSARATRQNHPESCRPPSRDGFEIEDLIERLEESTIGAANLKTQWYEQSRQLIEKKDKLFFHKHESRQVTENKPLNRLKAVNILKKS